MNVTLFLLLCLTLQQTPPSAAPGGTQKETTQPQADTQNQTAKRTQSASPVSAGESQPQSTSNTKQTDDSYDKWLNHTYEWATIFGVLGGWIVLLFIWRQTQSVIKAERAWIMVDVRGPATPDTRHRLVREVTTQAKPVSGETTATTKTIVAPVIFCRNQGRSPCWILEVHVRAEILNRDDVPVEPDFGKEFQIIKEIRPAGVNTDVPRSLYIQINDVRGEDAEGVPQIILLYGVVFYRDIFSKKRKTVFGSCIYGDDTPMLVEFPAYHKTT